MPRVLVIEDDEALKMVLVRALEGQGCSVDSAANGKAGLDAYERSPADVVVTDLLMPDVDGIETIRALRARSRALRIVAISGATDINRAALRAAKLLGADATLEKPFSLRELVEMVRVP